MIFEGWVPNATGNISFGVIGSSLAGPVKSRAHFRKPNHHWLICSETRRNHDSLLPFVSARLPQGQSAVSELVYAMAASSLAVGTDPQGVLEGQIFVIIPRTGAAAILELQAASTRLREAKILARQGHAHVDPATYWTGTLAAVAQASVFHCGFRLLRNGKCFLDVSAALGAGTPPLDPVTAEMLASQCYYFLKDAVHQHYHHRPKTDAIIELTPATSHDWRFRTQRNLYRKVLTLRRVNSDDRLSNALGVLAYAEVFNDLFGNRDYDSSGALVAGVASLPCYAKGLRDSIEVRRDRAADHRERRKSDTQFWVASGLAIIALFVALFEHFPKDSAAKNFGVWIIAQLGAHPWIAVAIAFIGWGIYSVQTGMRDVGDFSPVRWGYRLFGWVKRDRLVAFGGLIAILGTAAGAYMIWWASTHTTPPRTQQDNAVVIKKTPREKPAPPSPAEPTRPQQGGAQPQPVAPTKLEDAPRDTAPAPTTVQPAPPAPTPDPAAAAPAQTPPPNG